MSLDKISQATLTNKKLAIYLEKGTGEKAIAYYSSFKVNDESDNYRIASLGTYSYETTNPYQVPGDSMAITVNQKFTTKDRDNDTNPVGNCAHSYLGGWWYQQCHSANLNGYYFWSASNPTGYHSSYADGVNWYHFYPEVPAPNNGHYYSLKKVFMMIK